MQKQIARLQVKLKEEKGREASSPTNHEADLAMDDVCKALGDKPAHAALNHLRTEFNGVQEHLDGAEKLAIRDVEMKAVHTATERISQVISQWQESLDQAFLSSTRSSIDN